MLIQTVYCEIQQCLQHKRQNIGCWLRIGDLVNFYWAHVSRRVVVIDIGPSHIKLHDYDARQKDDTNSTININK